MTHAVWWPPPIVESAPFLHTTDHQFYTAAHLAYERGADGVSLFNFVYYRPRSEPPFHVIPRLRDRKWLAAQPQWNVLAKQSNHPQLPRTFEDGQSHAFTIDLAPAGRRDGLLRVRTLQPLYGEWAVKINGTALAPAGYVEKPLPNAYSTALGTAAEHRCFQCPRKLLREGLNELTLTLKGGGPATVEYMDLVLP